MLVINFLLLVLLVGLLIVGRKAASWVIMALVGLFWLVCVQMTDWVHVNPSSHILALTLMGVSLFWLVWGAIVAFLILSTVRPGIKTALAAAFAVVAILVPMVTGVMTLNANPSPVAVPNVSITAPQGTATATAAPTTEQPACDARFVQQWDSNDKNRSLSDGLWTNESAQTVTAEAAHAKQVEKLGHDARYLAQTAWTIGLHNDANNVAPLLNDTKTCLSAAGVELYGKTVAKLAAATASITDAPANGYNTGVQNDKMVVSETAGITGNRIAIKRVYADGSVSYTLIRCGNHVLPKPNGPRGKTDQDNPPVVAKVNVCRPGVGEITIPAPQRRASDLPSGSALCKPKPTPKPETAKVCRPGVGNITINVNDKRSSDLPWGSPACSPKTTTPPPAKVKVCRPGVGNIVIDAGDKRASDLPWGDPKCSPTTPPPTTTTTLKPKGPVVTHTAEPTPVPAPKQSQAETTPPPAPTSTAKPPSQQKTDAPEPKITAPGSTQEPKQSTEAPKPPPLPEAPKPSAPKTDDVDPDAKKGDAGGLIAAGFVIGSLLLRRRNKQ